MKYAVHFIILKCLLWQIDDNIYLFGTVHSVPQASFIWSPALDSALRTSEQVYFELDITRYDMRQLPGYVSTEDSICRMYQKPIKGLETIEQQLSLMQSLASASMGSASTVTDSTMYYYQNQDIYNLYRIVPYKEQVIDDRNRQWLTQIEQMDRPTFIAVGASHLYTLVNMLRTSGHRVKAVSIY